MAKNFVSNSKESVRMFRSNLLESLSKVHFSVPLFIYIPIIGYFLFQGQLKFATPFWTVLSYFVLGVLLWSLAEYVLHRYVFHFTPKGKLMERVHFIFHGVHHDYPNDTKRLVMPPSASLPLAVVFYFLFGLLLSPAHLYAFFPGFVTGYLAYDMCHYAMHHYNFKSEFWKQLKRHHMLHHYQDDHKRYGVSSVLWDKVFRSE
ncbi:sterol desaturase family protein [Rurimicrobium arvi]|uniref:Sterol desaturase family protein n=1 Tax=Rurimicrobium arvi TaxID=2049916 RepID=A0ABP8MGA6_9BACT